MTPKPTNLEGVWEFEPKNWPDKYDPRGRILQVWNRDTYQGARIGYLPSWFPFFRCAEHRDWPLAEDWVQENFTISDRKVLRGIHGYRDLWRLCYCAQGELYFIIINCKEGDSQFGKWQAWTLYGPQWGIFLVPPGFGMASLTLSQTSVFIYKWSGFYEEHEQFRYKWNDPRFKIDWPTADPILSEDDR